MYTLHFSLCFSPENERKNWWDPSIISITNYMFGSFQGFIYASLVSFIILSIYVDLRSKWKSETDGKKKPKNNTHSQTQKKVEKQKKRELFKNSRYIMTHIFTLLSYSIFVFDYTIFSLLFLYLFSFVFTFLIFYYFWNILFVYRLHISDFVPSCCFIYNITLFIWHIIYHFSLLFTFLLFYFRPFAFEF